MLAYILKKDNSLDFIYNCPPDIMEEDKFLLPSIPYTLIPPPQTISNKIAIFETDKWVVKDDYRGAVYWINNVGYRISNIGETIPSNATLYVAPPEIKSDEIVVSPWQIRQALNELNLRTQVENLVKSTSNIDIKDGWEFATEWKEFHPVIQSMGQELGLTSTQIHAIFVLAKSK